MIVDNFSTTVLPTDLKDVSSGFCIFYRSFFAEEFVSSAYHQALRKAQLSAKQAGLAPVPLDYHSIPLPSGKELDAYEVNVMAGMGHRSAHLSASKWLKYVEITSIDWSKTCRYVGSKIELRRK